MALDPTNPLSAIGASNDPSLTQRIVDQNKGAIDLQRGLAEIASRGQNQRANTTLTGNIAAEAAALKPFYDSNIIPNTPTSLEELATTRKSNLAGVDALAFANRSKGMVGLGELGRFAEKEPNQTASQSVRSDVPLTTGERTGDSKAAAGNTGKFTKEKGVKSTGVEIQRDGSWKTVVRTDKSTGVMKFSDPRVQLRARERAMELFDEKQIRPETIKVDDEGNITATAFNPATQQWIPNSKLHGVTL